MSRLRSLPEEPKHAIPHVALHDVETNEISMIPVMQVMHEYDKIEADGTARAFQMSDFFFESGEPLPHVNMKMSLKGLGASLKKGVNAMKKNGKKAAEMANKAKEKAAEMANKAKEKAKEAAAEIKKGYDGETDAKQDFNDLVY